MQLVMQIEEDGLIVDEDNFSTVAESEDQGLLSQLKDAIDDLLTALCPPVLPQDEVMKLCLKVTDLMIQAEGT